MEGINSAVAQVNTFIRGDQFFEWHGIVLASCWLVGAVIAILARKVSVQLHAILFFLIDAATAFFIVGAMIRVYPHMQERFNEWDIVKKSHFIGGNLSLMQVEFFWFYSSFNTLVEFQHFWKASNIIPLTENLDMLSVIWEDSLRLVDKSSPKLIKPFSTLPLLLRCFYLLLVPIKYSSQVDHSAK